MTTEPMTGEWVSHDRGDSGRWIMARIVVIEDSAALQRLIAVTMRGTGVDVEPYLLGSDGVDAVLAAPPDLVVLDLGLPDMSGWDVFDRLKSDPATNRTPVIVTTGEASGGVSDRDSSFGAGTLE